MFLQELQTVALLNQIAIGIVSKGNAILSDSSASCIVCKGVAIIARQLSAVCPSSRFSTVGCGVANSHKKLRACFQVRRKTIFMLLVNQQVNLSDFG